MAVTQPALSRSPGTTSVSWPGGKAWLRLSPHQSEVCGLGFLVRELQTGSVRAGPPGKTDLSVWPAGGKNHCSPTRVGLVGHPGGCFMSLLIFGQFLFCLFVHIIRILKCYYLVFIFPI